jgi:peroxiredoxin
VALADLTLPVEGEEPLRLGDVLARDPALVIVSQAGCPGCQELQGAFARIYAGFHDADLEVLHVVAGPGASEADREPRTGMLLIDPEGKACSALEISSLPAGRLIAADATIAARADRWEAETWFFLVRAAALLAGWTRPVVGYADFPRHHHTCTLVVSARS